MVGVKSYLPEYTPEFQDFRKRFRQKFRSDYPEEEEDEPRIFAVQAYTAMKLLERDSLENLHNWKPLPATSMEIVSVIGKGYHSVYWTQGLGFSEAIFDINGETTYTHSINDLVRSLWPRNPWYDRSQQHWDLVEMIKDWIRVGFRACLSLLKKSEEVKDDSKSGFVGIVFDFVTRNVNRPFQYCCFCCLKSLTDINNWFYEREKSAKKGEKHSEFLP